MGPRNRGPGKQEIGKPGDRQAKGSLGTERRGTRTMGEKEVWGMEAGKLGRWYRIHNTPFSSQLTNRPNKLDCSIKLSWNGIPMTNALTYWDSS